MTFPKSFDEKLDHIETKRRRRRPAKEKSFVRDEVEFSVLATLLDFILFGGWYVLAGLAFGALAILSFLGFIGFKVGALVVVVVALFVVFNVLSDS